MTRIASTNRTAVSGRASIPIGQNRLLRSQEFNLIWGSNQTTVTPDAILAPDGTMTADMLTDTAVSGLHTIAQTSGSALPGQIFTYSCYFKAGTISFASLFPTSANDDGITFDILNGKFGTVAGTLGNRLLSYGIEPASVTFPNSPAGWYRCWITISRKITGGSEIIYMNNADGSFSYTGGSGTIYVWGAQEELGYKPTTYTPTTSTAVINPTRSPVLIRTSIQDAPNSVAGMCLWLRSDMVAVDTAGNVGHWYDLSGSGKFLQQDSSPTKRPIQVANVFNGLPSIRGDGVNDVLYSLDSVFPTDEITMFTVVATTSTTSFGAWFSENQGGGSFRYDFYGNTTLEFKRWSTGPSVTLTALTPSVVHYTASGVNEQMFLNGVSGGTTSAREALTNRQFFVFGSTSLPAFPKACDIAEIILFNRVLSAGEITTIKSYLSTRYNIAVV